MNGTKRAQALETWTTSQCPFAIEYVPQVLDDIRMAVVAAFHRLSHGGLEIGGILLGSHSADRVSIADFRLLECEHAFGPSFRLSPSDHGRLSDAIAGAEAEGQTVVGWFHSHTRTGIFLSEADLEIHNRHFNDPVHGPRQVALVLKPIPLKPTLCGFFFREGDGSIHSQESYQEFELDGRTAIDGQARADAAERDGPIANPPAAPQSHGRRRETEELQETSQQPASALPPIDDPMRDAAFVPPVANAAQAWQSPDRARLRRKSEGLHFQWARVLAGMTIVLALGATYAYLSRSDPGVQATGQHSAVDRALGVQANGQQLAVDQALGLRLQRQGADLVVTWNRNAPDVHGATAGLLSIKDGAKRKEMGLSADQLRSANILLAPESDHVEIQLIVLLPNQRMASESSIAILPAQSSTGALVRNATAPNATAPSAPTPYATAPIATKPNAASPNAATPNATTPNATTPSSSYTAALIRAESRGINSGKAFVAPPGRREASDTRPIDQPPALKVSDAPAPIPSNASAAFKTAPSVLPAPPAPEPKRPDATAPATAPAAPPVAQAGQASPGPTSPGSPANPLPLGGTAQPAELISHTNPSYPFAARTGHVQGIVVLEGVIGTNGQVKELKVVSGLKVFRKAALAAVSQWVYNPAKLNGKTVEAPMRVEIKFREGM